MRLFGNTRPGYDRKLFRALSAAIFCSMSLLHAQEEKSQLANATVLIIRHAEKPASGSSLTPEGFARAEKYARYFHPFRDGGTAMEINALYAGTDSASSVRPRLTVEPLSRATGIPVDTRFSTDDSAGLAHALATEPHGDHVLIAWRHKKISGLLKALGADPALLLPDGAWPDAVFDWVVLLQFDAAGQLRTQRLIHEPNPLP